MRSRCLHDSSSLRILHLEDNPLDALLIESALQVHLSCQITVVASKLAFQAVLDQAAPDLILSDSSLPSFDGISALQLATQKYPKVPFIFCSGCVSDQKKAQALMCGAKDCIPKNDLEGLIASIKRLCGSGW